MACHFCDRPAPGDSGRCSQHQAQKYATVDLVCQNPNCPRQGAPFRRYGSWLAERQGRGHYCSNRCKGQATTDAETLR
jgi:hypothetical protein